MSALRFIIDVWVIGIILVVPGEAQIQLLPSGESFRWG